jgi:hypothetical protein
MRGHLAQQSPKERPLALEVRLRCQAVSGPAGAGTLEALPGDGAVLLRVRLVGAGSGPAPPTRTCRSPESPRPRRTSSRSRTPLWRPSSRRSGSAPASYAGTGSSTRPATPQTRSTSERVRHQRQDRHDLHPGRPSRTAADTTAMTGVLTPRLQDCRDDRQTRPRPGHTRRHRAGRTGRALVGAMVDEKAAIGSI